MRFILKRLLMAAVCVSACYSRPARASVIADWSFPATGTATSPVSATSSSGTTGTPTIGGTLFSTMAAHGGSVTYAANPGPPAADALAFQFGGNHAGDMNGNTLTITLTASTTISFSDLIYATQYTPAPSAANPLTQTWTYVISGGGSGSAGVVNLTNPQVNSEDLSLSITLNAGQTITFTDTISGAQGNNGKLDFENVQLAGLTTPVPEPMTWALIGFGVVLGVSGVVKRVGESKV